MKNLFSAFILIIAIYQVKAQIPVNITGQIEHFNMQEVIYLGTDELLIPLEIAENGRFLVDVNVQQLPSIISFNKISTHGKIEQQLPQIWFDTDTIEINLDWKNRSFKMQNIMPYQSISERIENLNQKERIKFMLSNPNYIPSLYFADREKEKIAIADLETFTQNINKESKNSIYIRRIEKYIEAKRRNPIRKGRKIEDFHLPDKNDHQISIINHSQKPKVIALLSSGCLFSITSIELLEQLHLKNKDKIEIITIWQDESKDTWLNSNKDKKNKITWVNLWDQLEFASTYLGNEIWPTFYLVNSNGILTDRFSGYNKKSINKLKRLTE